MFDCLYDFIQNTYFRMSTNQKVCDICDERHITKHATHWCSECDQAICSECLEFHSFSRLSKCHATIPILDHILLEQEASNVTSICTEHNDIYHLVCLTHDQLLCLHCIEKHNECKDIVPLSEITKNVKSSTNFQETQQDITNVNENINKIQDQLKLHLKTVNDDEKMLMTEISTMRKKAEGHLDKLEDDLRQNISKRTAQSRHAINELLQTFDGKKSEITKKQQQMKDLERYASDFQTYLSLRQLSSAVDSTESFVQSVAKDGFLEIDTFSLNFEENINQIVDNIHQFGLVKEHKNAYPIALIRQKDKQAQLVGTRRPVIKSVNDIKLKLVSKIDAKFKCIKGCEILSDGKIVLSNSDANGYVVVLDSDGKHLFDIPETHDVPCIDITCIDNKSKLAISSGFVQCIHVIDISKPEEQKRIPIKNSCYGVAYSDGSILCYIHKEGIQKISLDNYEISTIVKFELSFGYIDVHNKRMYYTDRDTNVVTCSDMEGQLVWTFKDETVLKEPCGISVDAQGFVYVISRENSSVVVLSTDGQDKRVLLSNADGLKSPWVLHYDKLRNRLLVANEEASAFLFDVSA